MSFFKGSQTLLKQYIDARFPVIRLEKLRTIGSNHAFNASEAAELNECISKYTDINKGVDNVSREGNTSLVKRVRSLINEVQDLDSKNKQTAVQAADKDRIDGYSKIWAVERARKLREAEVEKLLKATEAEKARKAEANPEPVNIPAGGEWVLWWDADLNAPYFQDPVTKQTVWTLPAGKPFRHGDDLSINNPRSVQTTARFQSINPYLVS
jgi:hypothetical protein